MKPETLEALFIDRAVGELSPEAAELVDAWGQQHPADCSRASAVATTLALAREAIAGDATAPHPPLPEPRWNRNRWNRRRSELLRLAACLALGAGIGWTLHPPQPLLPAGAVAGPAPAFASAAEPPSTTSRFWSISARIDAMRQTAVTMPKRRPDDPFSSRKSLLRMPQPNSLP